MADGLKIKIGADVKEGVEGVKEFNTEVAKIRPASSQAFFALQSLNRVVQDLPFGFVAIQNNIEEIPNAFRSLSVAAKESGQTIGSTLLKTLSGAGGVGVAVSVLTSALTFATVGFGAWTRGLNNSGKAAKDAAGDIDEYTKAATNAADAVSKDAAKASTLVLALQSGTLNLEQRKEALKELKNINVEFFGSLKEEKGIIDGLQGAYDGYLHKLDQIATSKALESQLTKLFDKKLELELSIDPKFLASTSAETQERIGRFKKELAALGGPVDFSKEQNNLQQNNEQLNKRIALQTKIEDLERGAAFFKDKNLTAVEEQIKRIDLQINGLRQVQKDLGVFDVGEVKDSGLKKEKDDVDKLRHAIVLSRQEAAKQAELLDIILNHKLPPPRKAAFEGAPQGNGALDNLNEKDFSAVNQHLLEMQKLTKGIISIVPELGRAFSSVFEDIASGGKNSLELFGQAIAGVVKKLIAAAITALIFTAIIGAATGGAGFLDSAGKSTNFIGQFKALFGQLGGLKLAGGGITTGPTLATIGDNPGGREAVIPLDDKILKNLRGEGGGGDGFIAVTDIGFDKLLIGIRRQQRREGFQS